MAIATLLADFPTGSFLGRKREFLLETIEDFISFDLLINESHNMPLEVTTHKIESGSDITENIKIPLRTGSITGFVTNMSAKREVFASNPFSLDSNKAQDTFDLLKQFRESRTPVTIVTNLDVYEDVLLTNASATRGPEEGEGQTFTISFTESKFVKLQTVAIDTTVSTKGTGTNQDRQASQKLNVGRR